MMKKQPPLPSTTFSVWEARWQALKTNIENYEKRLTTYREDIDYNKGVLDPSIRILEVMLQRLKDFAAAQFHFFLDGFWTQQDYKLKESESYPADYVLGTTLKQIAFDLEAIQRTAEQRMWASGDMKNTLEKADELVNEAIGSAYSVIKGTKPTVITYFEKSHSVRVFPYDCVALIAVPYTCVPFEVKSGETISKEQVTRDYVALLHELGHYIFWHGKVTTDDKEVFIHKYLHETLKPMRSRNVWCYRWVEEIFADIFGCLMGGPLIALDFQDMASVASSKEFLKDDRQHPVPAVRPEIYIEILMKVVDPQNPEDWWGGRVDSLTGRWKTLLDSRWKTDNSRTLKLVKRTAESKLPFTNVKSTVREVIDTIYAMLSAQGTLSSIRLKWSGTADDEITNITDLYQIFKNYINTPFSGSEDLEECTPETWEEWVTNNDFLEEKFPLNSDTSISSGEGNSETHGWLNVLYAGGWATKGPTTNPSVK